jgi:hypothetical protein
MKTDPRTEAFCIDHCYTLQPIVMVRRVKDAIEKPRVPAAAMNATLACGHQTRIVASADNIELIKEANPSSRSVSTGLSRPSN